jgi:hypothetical protein
MLNRKMALLFAFITAFFITSSTFAKQSTRDSYIEKYLKKNEGGLVIPYTHHVVKEKKLDKIKEYKDISEFLKSESDYNSAVRIRLYFFTPEKPDKEIELAYDGLNKCFLLMGPPGEYVLTRGIYGNEYGIISNRIFGKINIEKGMIKYVGDLKHISVRNGIFFVKGEAYIEFDFDDFQKRLPKLYPKSKKYFVGEKMIYDNEP